MTVEAIRGASPFDVAILGAGPVGCALALLLAGEGVPPAAIALLDRQPRERAFADRRPIALSAGSLALLATLIDLERLEQAPIRTVHVSQRGLFGRTLMHAREEGLERLGAVVRYGALMRALDAAVDASGVTAAHAVDADDMRGPRWSARVAVHAEGRTVDADGQVIDATAATQSAIVCEISASQSRRDVAYERFTPRGPIALLPLPEAGRHAVVWCEAPGSATRIGALDDDAFAERLQQHFGDRLGRLGAPSPRIVMPIASTRSARDADASSIRIGNAAQTLHPVAGQGLNLGLRDAALLARALGGAEGHVAEALDRFRRRRETDRAGTLAMTDLFAHGFGGHRGTWLAPFGTPARAGGAVALALLDAIPPLRRRFAERLIYGIRD